MFNILYEIYIFIFYIFRYYGKTCINFLANPVVLIPEQIGGLNGKIDFSASSN